MPKIELSSQEIELLKRSIDHCLSTCHQGGIEQGCPDCQSLRDVLAKLS